MSKNNNMLKSLKNSLMLNCDSATLLVTKNEYEKLKCSERLRLKMHLASCKFCRRFKLQSEFISKNIQNISNPENKHLAHKLTTEQKQNLTKVIQDHYSK